MLFLYWVRYIIPITAPMPYIGQYGPIKKPRSTIFFWFMLVYIDSIIQPNTEYIKNKIKYLHKMYIIIKPFFLKYIIVL